MTTTPLRFSHPTPTRTGECPTCGHHADLRTDGRIKTHNERRIRRGQLTNGTRAALTYTSTARCTGTGQRPARNED